MLTAYFDESGTDATSEIATLAAYVSPDERWARFTAEWFAVLHDPRFAIGEFKTADWYGKYDEFEKFRDPKRRTHWQRLWAMLTRVIDNRVRFGVSVSVPVREHAALTKPRLPARSALRDPYNWAMQACLEAIEQTEERRGEMVACVFDDGHKHRGLAEARFRGIVQHRGWEGTVFDPSVTRASSAQVPPLQAADALAWTTRKHVDALRQDPNAKPGRELIRLRQRVPIFRGRLNVARMVQDTDASVARAITEAGDDLDNALAALARYRAEKASGKYRMTR
jgi:hypothetical protein